MRCFRNLPIARTLAAAALFACLTLGADAVLGCPTCKDQLAHDPASANVARGYALSILFMLAMPPLILTGLGSYFYWEIRKARLAQGQQPTDGAGPGSFACHLHST